MNDEFSHRLQIYYKGVLPDKVDVVVDQLERLTGGWESELYAFVLARGSATERVHEQLVLRLYSGYSAHEKSAHEFAVLRRLDQAGYPVPKVHRVETEDSPFGRPFIIMERIAGPAMWSLMLGRDGEEKIASLDTLCELYVQLHNLDWRVFVDQSEVAFIEDPYVFVDRWFRRINADIERFSMHGFWPVMEWLQARRGALACPRPALVHGDFHPGNILFRDDGSPVVIDWTGSEISDARFDLAWTLVLACAYMGSTWRGRILKAYERFAGQEIAAIEQFEVFACLRRLIDIAVSLSQGAEQRGMRPQAVAEMRADMEAHVRVYELLMARTGTRVEDVERMMASL